jgi:uncharacterized membrane protein
MYVVALAALQWVHILCGIFWFGSVLTADFIVLPTLRTLSPDVQGAFLRAFVTRAPRIVTVIGGMTILLGVVRGIAGGVLSDLRSAYGLTWMAAFIVGSSLLFLGTRILTPAAHRLIEIPPGPEFETAMARIKRLTLTEIAGFLMLLAFMIAMRFGY